MTIEPACRRWVNLGPKASLATFKSPSPALIHRTQLMQDAIDHCICVIGVTSGDVFEGMKSAASSIMTRHILSFLTRIEIEATINKTYIAFIFNRSVKNIFCFS